MGHFIFPMLLLFSTALSGTGAFAAPSAEQAANSAPNGALIEGQRFTVEVQGAGRDIILIPGLASPRDVWDGTGDALKEDGKLHLVQIRGFGDAPGMNVDGPVLAPFVSELADYIRTEIIAKGRPAPVIIGHSLGGLAALMIGTEHPELAGKLIVVDALPFIGPIFRIASVDAIRPQAQAMAAATRATVPQSDETQDADPGAFSQAGFLSKSVSGRTQVARWTRLAHPHVMAQALYDDMVTDVRPELSKIKAPLTVLYADDASVMPTGMVDALYAAEYKNNSSTKLVKISDSRHFIMLDQPGQFHAALKLELVRN